MSLSGSQSKIKSSMYKGTEVIIKKSKHIDYTIELEAIALKKISSLNTLKNYFPKLLNICTIKKKGIEKPQLIMTKINAVNEFHEFIRRILKSPSLIAIEIIISLVCITLCVCENLRRELGIVHNDLHTSNVLVVKTELEYVQFDFDGNTYKYKTYGFLPIIIDFGYAYVKGEKMLAPMFCADIGYFTYEEDLLSDARILLNKIQNAMLKYRNKEDKVIRLVKIIDSLFYPLDLDKNGWFQTNHFTDVINEMLNVIQTEMNDEIGLFNDNYDESEDLMNLFIAQILPPSLSEEEVEINYNENDIITKFKAFKTEALNLHKFSSVGVTKQLNIIKTWLSSSHNNVNPSEEDKVINLCKIVAKSFEPLIYTILLENRKKKQFEYAKITVKNTLEILNELKDFI
jgi:hypothetical protein